jgi:hypothetical protein
MIDIVELILSRDDCDINKKDFDGNSFVHILSSNLVNNFQFYEDIHFELMYFYDLEVPNWYNREMRNHRFSADYSFHEKKILYDVPKFRFFPIFLVFENFRF